MPTVLIVDNNEDLRRLAGRALRRSGFDVAEACSSVFDLGIFQLGRHGQGIDAAQQMLREGRVKRVVFWTGSTDTVLIDDASKLGVVIAKTDGLHHLIRVLSEANSLHRTTTRSATTEGVDTVGPMRKAGVRTEPEQDDDAAAG